MNQEYENKLQQEIGQEIMIYTPELKEDTRQLNNAKKVLIYGFQTPQEIHNIPELAETLAKETSRFVRMPSTIEQIRAELERPKYANPALIHHHENTHRQHHANAILHEGVKPGQTDWMLQEAYDAFKIEGTPEQVIQYLQKQVKTEPQTNKSFPGLFVDIDGTIIKERKLNYEAIETMLGYTNGPVNIWTGGNVTKQIKELKKIGLNNALEGTNLQNRITVLSKVALRGATVDQTIDDLTAEQLEEQYSIKTRSHAIV